MVLTFGKYKGRKIHKCPSSYLRWLALNCDWDVTVQEEADEEYNIREHQNAHWEED